MSDFAGKTIIVTGGGGGIGGATCRRFAAEGGRVAVHDRDLAAAERVAAEITASGGTARAFACDITNRASVEAAVAATEAELGSIDVLVNNAGWDVFKPFLQTEPSEWERLIAINLMGALTMHHVVLPGMVARKSGRVVNIASDAAGISKALISSSGIVGYCDSTSTCIEGVPSFLMQPTSALGDP